jgi:cytochrome c oxidase accessory protein FixG
MSAFAKRERTYPQSIKGRFRRIKSTLNTFFLAIYFLTPLVRFDRGESSPNQAVFIDIPNSRAYFFFIEIWAQEVYYLAFILILSAVALFFITSLFGRIWCGYACFQTVWTDIFIAIERLFQGDRNQRIILDRKKYFQKFYKKFLTHSSWIMFSILTGYGFVSYFNDAIFLAKNILSIKTSVLFWTLGIALATYIMAGFAREQVCIFMCPYARFQSAMFDDNTLIITYDEKRGEPRAKHKQGDSFDNRGHCIDCKQCVVVCPQNIDIRNGLQMECIACGLCIDACDSVMEKIGLPKGLIRYDTSKHLASPTKQNKFKFLQKRTIYYFSIILTTSCFMMYNLTHKTKLETSIIPDRNPLFVRLSDGSIRNGYTIKIINKTYKDKVFDIKILSPAFANIKIQSYQESLENIVMVRQNEAKSFKVYVSIKNNSLQNLSEKETMIQFLITDKTTDARSKINAVFIFND